MLGGTGDDVYIVESAGNLVVENGNEGADLVRSGINYTLIDNTENLQLTGTANLDGTGNVLDNILTGNGGDNLLDGAAGIDTLAGGLGDDTYLVTRPELADLVGGYAQASSHAEQLALLDSLLVNGADRIFVANWS